MQKFSVIIILAVPFFLGVACKTAYQVESLQYNDYRISHTGGKDSSLLLMIQPYSANLEKSMNDIIGYLETSLDKKSPESTLGNFMVDAFYIMAKEKFRLPVDVAFMNFGGIRLTQLPAGDITRGKIFEIMPFDNMLIIQRLKGSVLQELLDLIAARGGWPVAGMTMQIKDKKAVNVRIGNEPLNPARIYITANSDFVANGGDNAEMLKTIPQENIGYGMRDALIDYVLKLKSEGRKITASVENRITYAQ